MNTCFILVFNGLINQEKLFNTLAPISFNAFAKKDFLDKMAKTKKKPKPISKSKK